MFGKVPSWQARSAVALGLTVGSLVVARPAVAEVPSTVLSWSAPAECPDESALRAAVERHLGQSFETPRDQRLDISGTLSGDATSGYTATLRLTSKHGVQKRVLQHFDCYKLTLAASLVIALAIDPMAHVTTTPEALPPPPVPAPPPPLVTPSGEAPAAEPVPPVAEPARSPVLTPSPAVAASSPRAPLHWSAGAFGRVTGGPLPRAGAGLGVRGSINPSRLGVTMWGAYDLPRFSRVRGDAGVEFELWSLGLGPCYRLRTAFPALDGCAEFALGELQGTGRHVNNDRARQGLWSAALLEIFFHQKVSSSIFLLGGLQAGDTFNAPRFGLREDGREVEVFGAARWFLSAFVGLGFGNP